MHVSYGKCPALPKFLRSQTKFTRGKVLLRGWSFGEKDLLGNDSSGSAQAWPLLWRVPAEAPWVQAGLDAGW